jgi:ABC-type multidrug transport system ATPase subunit
MHDPDILLLDEPYSAFDWETYLKFWNFALKLKQKGKTILIVSHLLYDRQKIDEIWKIEKGELVCE